MTTKISSRHYLLTLNNPEYALEDELAQYLQDNILTGYNCNLEIGESNGVLHYQFMVCLKRDQKPSYVKKLWPQAHNEICDDPYASWTYCAKDETRVAGPWTGGQGPAGQGRRTDITALRDAVLNGATDVDLFKTHTRSYLAYYNGIERIRLALAKPRSEPTELYIILGPTGTGKTRFVAEKEPDLYWKQPGSQWWDGYHGQEAVILDDFYGWMAPHELLRLADRYPLMVQVKGSQVNFNSKRLYITSNKVPTHWWKEETMSKYDMSALWRRVTLVICIPKPGEIKEYLTYQDFYEDQIVEELPASPVV